MSDITQEQLDAAIAETSKRAAAEATTAANKAAAAAATAAKEETDATLADIQTKLDKAEEDRLSAEGKIDEARKVAAERESAAVTKRIEQAENRAKAAEDRVDTMQEEARVAQRDRSVSDAFSEAEFVGGAAKTFAVERFLATLNKNDDGEWRTEAGEDIEAGATAFMGDEDNAFLFTPKGPQGSRATVPTPQRQRAGTKAAPVETDATPANKMSDEELLANADALTEDDINNWN